MDEGVCGKGGGMKYILTSKELKTIKESQSNEINHLKELLKTVCHTASINIPRNEYGWTGCVELRTTEYCDDCPCLKECLYDYKEFSK